MNRRTFLRVLGVGLVGAAVAQAIPISLPESLSPSWDTGTARPLTLEMLREAYEKCANAAGDRSPDYLITSRKVYQTYARMSGLVYDLEVAA